MIGEGIQKREKERMKSLICSYSSSSEALCRYTYIIATHCHNQIAYRELKEVPSHPPHPYRGTIGAVYSLTTTLYGQEPVEPLTGRPCRRWGGQQRKCCPTRTRCICGDSSHPRYGPFTLLPSEKRLVQNHQVRK